MLARQPTTPAAAGQQAIGQGAQPLPGGQAVEAVVAIGRRNGDLLVR